MITNPMYWNWNQYAAAGRHVLNTGCTVVATLAATHFIAGLTPQSAAAIADNANHIWNGLVETGTGIAGLIAALAPIYTAIKAATASSPANTIQSVIKTLSSGAAAQAANATADPSSRTQLISAVAQMPEVKAIVAAPAVAQAAPSDKVVASATDIPRINSGTVAQMPQQPGV
jgi:hypothetical protein